MYAIKNITKTGKIPNVKFISFVIIAKIVINKPRINNHTTIAQILSVFFKLRSL